MTLRQTAARCGLKQIRAKCGSAISRRELARRDVTAVTPSRFNTVRSCCRFAAWLDLTPQVQKQPGGTVWDGIAPLPQSVDQLTNLLDIAPRKRRYHKVEIVGGCLPGIVDENATLQEEPFRLRVTGGLTSERVPRRTESPLCLGITNSMPAMNLRLYIGRAVENYSGPFVSWIAVANHHSTIDENMRHAFRVLFWPFICAAPAPVESPPGTSSWPPPTPTAAPPASSIDSTPPPVRRSMPA